MRRFHAIALAATIALGLAVHAHAKLVGDALYAVAAFFAFALALPRSCRIWLYALTYCTAIELLQLYHPPWLEAARDTLPGRLILGRVFSAYDLLAYAVGVAAAALISWLASRDSGRERV